MTSLPRLSNRDARRLFLYRHGLSGQLKGTGNGADLAGVIDDLGFVQLDSINTVARAHHMILHSRRQSYRPPNLDRAYVKDRAAFEHWTHDASVISMRFFPHWRHKMRRNTEKLRTHWKVWRRPGFEEKAEDVLRQIADHGPCCSSDVGKDEERSSGGWWDWHPSKTALEYLWRKGDLSVCHRKGFRKYYDLTENVIPPEYLNARTDLQDTLNWACDAALDRLGFANSTELANFWDLTSKAEAKAWCADALRDGRIIEIALEGHDGELRPTFARADVFDAARAAPEAPGAVRIMSPFDPALRDRIRAERLFGFDYRIEIFVPEAKRKYGYYVFPVLEGDRLIGRIDMKCDAKTDILTVRAFWPERSVKMGSARLKRLNIALERTARLSGAKQIDFADDWIRT